MAMSDEERKRRKREYQKAYRQTEKGKKYYKEYQKRYREEHPEAYIKASTKYREANREKCRDVSRRSKEKNFISNWNGKILSCIKTRCKKRGLPFNLEKEDIVVPEYCPVLGIKLEFKGKRSHSPSVDKIIPEKGYVKGNIQVISMRANQLKNNASLEELKKIVAYVETHK